MRSTGLGQGITGDGIVRAGPDAIPRQQLTFEPGAPYATKLADEALFANERFGCARMQVPLDYADPDGPRAEQADQLRQVREAAPIMDDGTPVTESVHECAAWPEPPSRTGPFFTGEVDVPPILVTSVTGDPTTPHQGGVNLARTLGGTPIIRNAAT